jgi:hypothetical protein
MNDMRAVTQPKTDQLNADSLLAGPITITITGVDIKPKTEQPATVHYQGEEGRPYKPCLSMRRVMQAVWGADSSQYVGKSMTLFCDPTVSWGGQKVGGIRISHMSHMGDERELPLTVTRGVKKPYKVKPLATQAARPKKTFAEAMAEIDALDLEGLAAWQEANEAMADNPKPEIQKLWARAFERAKILAAEKHGVGEAF